MRKAFYLIWAFSAMLSSAAAPQFSQGAAFESRVLIAEDAYATRAFRAEPGLVRELFTKGFLAFTGKSSEKEAWLSLVTTSDVVGVKVFTAPGPNSGTRFASTASLVESLLAAGIAPSNIVVWDKRESDLRAAGYFELKDRYKIEVAGAMESGFNTNHFYESSLLGNLVWGDFEFSRKGENIGRNSYVSKLVQRLTKIVVLSPLLNHNLAGVTGSLYSLSLGSIDNTIRFDLMGERLATAVPEIYALEVLADRAVLHVSDALICQYLGEERTLLHYSVQLGQLWFSRDPVALDVVAINEMQKHRKAAGIIEPKYRMEIYKNASLLELGISDYKKIQVDRK